MINKNKFWCDVAWIVLFFLYWVIQLMKKSNSFDVVKFLTIDIMKWV